MFPSIDCERSNPLRPLDWRWRRAVQLVETGARLSTLRADDTIGSTVRYLRKLNSLRTAKGKAWFEQKNCAVADALAFARAPCVQRAVLQAGILSREPAEVSGNRVGLSGPAVDVFEDLFFNVRDRLSARCWILLAAVNQGDGQDDAERVRLRLLRMLAHRGGPFILELALSAFGYVHSPDLDQGCQQRIRLLAGIESANFSLFELADLAEISMSRNRTSQIEATFDQSILESFLGPDMHVDGPQCSGEPLDIGPNAQCVEAA